MRRSVLSIMAMTVVLVVGSTTARDVVRAAPTDQSAEWTLAQRHAPVIIVQQQTEPCAEGEPYAPVPVDVVLDNPEVSLRQIGTGDPVARWGPTVDDLASYGAGFFLDFPGSALRPGCLYEADGRRFLGDRPATIYARVVPPGQPGQPLVLQYWFFWYFNDWNDKHEGDWEGIQLLFPADTAEAALTVTPTEMGYAQHEGGEWARWNDSKVQRDGDRPWVYSSAGSHASYYTSAVSLGRGATEGFGCDDTTGPSRRIDPEVTLLPTEAGDARGELAWLSFPGRWGERWSGPFNGPTGPADKARWHDPWTWQDQLRDGSIAIPGGSGTTAQVVGAFCALVSWGSGQVIELQLNPLRVLLPAALLALVVAWVVQRTRGPFRSATRTVVERASTLVPLGVLGLPVSLVVGALVWFTRHIPVVDDVMDLIDPRRSDSPTRLIGSVLTGGVAIAGAFTVVTAAVALASSRQGGAAPSLVEAGRQVVGSWRPLVGVLVRTAVPVTLLSLTTIGLPVALWLFARWHLAPTVVIREGVAAREAMHRSSQMVRGHTMSTLLTALVAQVVVVGAGVVVGLAVLTLVTGLPLWALTMVVTAVTTVVMPWAATVVVELYERARARVATP